MNAIRTPASRSRASPVCGLDEMCHLVDRDRVGNYLSGTHEGSDELCRKAAVVAQARGLSQLDLAGRAEISQRHLSFLELARASPSRPMVLRLAEAFDIPLRQHNALLLAAGFAPTWRESGLDTPELAQIAGAVDRMLAKQEPFPAVAVDRHWRLLKANAAAVRLVDDRLHTQRKEPCRSRAPGVAPRARQGPALDANPVPWLSRQDPAARQGVGPGDRAAEDGARRRAARPRARADRADLHDRRAPGRQGRPGQGYRSGARRFHPGGPPATATPHGRRRAAS